MFWIVLSLITVLFLFVVLGFSGGRQKTWSMRPIQLISLLGLLWMTGGVVASVPTGHTGILTTFGKVEDTTLEAGVHAKLPWQQVVVLDNRTQKSALTLACFSSDIQEVQVNYSINYQIQKENAQKIYKTIGVNYYDLVMDPRIQEAVRSVISKYNAESLIENRDLLSVQITTILTKELAAFNIEVVNTAIEDLDFSDAFTNAVEEKQVAQQSLLKAQTVQEQLTMEQQSLSGRLVISAQAEADVAVIQAEAEKQVLQIQADAAEYAGQKDAAINDALSATLTEILLKYYEIKQWNGELPDYYVSGVDGVLPILGSASGTE